MKRLTVLHTLAVSAAAIAISGCGNGVPGETPVFGSPQLAAAVARPSSARSSWVLAEARRDDLLYVGGNNSYLAVYSYPKGKLVGVVENQNFGLLVGDCVDKTGNIFITSLDTETIFEYKHGGTKPIATIKETGEGPVDCSIDPATGNLAVTNFGTTGSGNVQVYVHAKGTPATYVDLDIFEPFFCAYDDNGNLYLDGTHTESSPTFKFAELPKGTSSFTNITLNQTVDWPGSVQWDGKYIAVGDQATPDVYEFSVSGSTGRLEHTTPINGVMYDNAFWIQGRRIVVANSESDSASVDFFKYRAGGNPRKLLTKDIAGPDGLTVSLAK